jgi:hypothetical protein
MLTNEFVSKQGRRSEDNLALETLGPPTQYRSLPPRLIAFDGRRICAQTGTYAISGPIPSTDPHRRLTSRKSAASLFVTAMLHTPDVVNFQLVTTVNSSRYSQMPSDENLRMHVHACL